HDEQFFLDYDFYSDGRDCDFKWLDRTFVSNFILNTRNLKGWLVSRWNHVERNKAICFKNKKKRGWITNDMKSIIEWIYDRNLWHYRVLQYFNGKNNLQILNLIEDDEE